MRFITQERFDLVKKNMTKEEVIEVVGPPYYQNIQIDEAKGVETWLYPQASRAAPLRSTSRSATKSPTTRTSTRSRFRSQPSE